MAGAGQNRVDYAISCSKSLVSEMTLTTQYTLIAFRVSQFVQWFHFDLAWPSSLYWSCCDMHAASDTMLVGLLVLT